VAVINSIFKHSEGYVMTRWNDNKDEFHITDIFGTPENGAKGHILYGACFATEACARGCHWFPRLLV
jgi:hypothetical protein